eukprot:scaffold5431_cov93-Isochrysis_galbana.AAC.2
MGPREDIFSTSGAPESRMNTTSTSAAAATSAQSLADLSKTLKSRRCGPAGKRAQAVPTRDLLFAAEFVTIQETAKLFLVTGYRYKRRGGRTQANAGRMMAVVSAAAEARQILARVKLLREAAAEGARRSQPDGCLWERLCAAVEREEAGVYKTGTRLLEAAGVEGPVATLDAAFLNALVLALESEPLPNGQAAAWQYAMLRTPQDETAWRKNPAWFSHVARAHRWVAPLTNSRPPMAARCEALPSTHLSSIQ